MDSRGFVWILHLTPKASYMYMYIMCRVSQKSVNSLTKVSGSRINKIRSSEWHATSSLVAHIKQVSSSVWRFKDNILEEVARLLKTGSQTGFISLFGKFNPQENYKSINHQTQYIRTFTCCQNSTFSFKLWVIHHNTCGKLPHSILPMLSYPLQ